jgi:hypothetical protein
MTVSSTTRKAGPFSGNGSTTSFPFSFKVFTKADVQVVRADASGAETTLTLDSDYSVAVNADQTASPGGTITYPITGSPLASGLTLTVVGAMAYSQGTSLPTGGAFNAANVEAAFDKTTILIQQLLEQVGRAVKVSVSSGIDPTALLASISAAVSAASASASAAAGSATAAAGSATAAAGSATAAAGSATAAANSATAAATSATNAAAAVSAAIGVTVQGYDAAMAKTNVVQSFTKAQRGAVVALTYGATITPDFATGNNFSTTLTGNATLANPTNLVAGQHGVITVTQDATGSRTLAFGSNWKFANGTAPTLTTTASAVDDIAYYVESSTRIVAKVIGAVA